MPTSLRFFFFVSYTHTCCALVHANISSSFPSPIAYTCIATYSSAMPLPPCFWAFTMARQARGRARPMTGVDADDDDKSARRRHSNAAIDADARKSFLARRRPAEFPSSPPVHGPHTAVFVWLASPYLRAMAERPPQALLRRHDYSDARPRIDDMPAHDARDEAAEGRSADADHTSWQTTSIEGRCNMRSSFIPSAIHARRACARSQQVGTTLFDRRPRAPRPGARARRRNVRRPMFIAARHRYI